MLQPLTQFDFYERIGATRGVALVLFSAAACGSCRHWKTFLAQYAAAHDGVQVFEVDAGLEPALAQEYELFHLPALFMFVDGEYHAPLACEPRAPELEKMINHLRQLPAEEAP